MYPQNGRAVGVAAGAADWPTTGSSDSVHQKPSALGRGDMTYHVLEPNTGTVCETAFLDTVLLDEDALSSVELPLVVVPEVTRRSALEVPTPLAVEDGDDSARGGDGGDLYPPHVVAKCRL